MKRRGKNWLPDNNDAFVVYGLFETPDTPECCIRLLDTTARKWRVK